MIIRLIASNFYSFSEEVEFNTLLSSRQTDKTEHIYSIGDLQFLKMSAIYGANSAGKSNVLKLLYSIRKVILSGKVGNHISRHVNKFVEKGTPQLLGIEFLLENKIYIYAIQVIDGILRTEQLYRSEPNNIKEEEIVFERSFEDGKNKILFSSELSAKNQAFLKVFEKNVSKKNLSVIKSIAALEEEGFEIFSKILDYFKNGIAYIRPDSKPKGLALKIEKEEEFRSFVIDMMSSFGIGIKSIQTESVSLLEIAKVVDQENLENIKEFVDEFKKDGTNDVMQLSTPVGEELLIIEEDNDVVVKRIVIEHSCRSGKSELFHLEEESDGTIRILEYMPLLYDMLYNSKVYFVDEIERSIHPLLMKNILQKFGEDENTKGQLLFTTHETNLLDQTIFRKDEIWFIEKDLDGGSKMYPLSDFKEHHSKNIQKGYLAGRYGAIPFLGNLEDLNWNKYALAH